MIRDSAVSSHPNHRDFHGICSQVRGFDKSLPFSSSWICEKKAAPETLDRGLWDFRIDQVANPATISRLPDKHRFFANVCLERAVAAEPGDVDDLHVNRRVGARR